MVGKRAQNATLPSPLVGKAMRKARKPWELPYPCTLPSAPGKLATLIPPVEHKTRSSQTNGGEADLALGRWGEASGAASGKTEGSLEGLFAPNIASSQFISFIFFSHFRP